MTPSEVYEKFINGDSIDESLISGLLFYKDLLDRLYKCGPVFKLAANEANNIYLCLYDYAKSRQLYIPGDKSVNEPTITWNNILNYKHIRLFTHDLGSFAKLAKDIGYPYFNWNDRIYSTSDWLDTGVFAKDVVN